MILGLQHRLNHVTARLIYFENKVYVIRRHNFLFITSTEPNIIFQDSTVLQVKYKIWYAVPKNAKSFSTNTQRNNENRQKNWFMHPAENTIKLKHYKHENKTLQIRK